MSKADKKELIKQLIELIKTDESIPEYIRIGLMLPSTMADIIETLAPYGPIYRYTQLERTKEELEAVYPVRKQLYELLTKFSADLDQFIADHPLPDVILTPVDVHRVIF